MVHSVTAFRLQRHFPNSSFRCSHHKLYIKITSDNHVCFGSLNLTITIWANHSGPLQVVNKLSKPTLWSILQFSGTKINLARNTATNKPPQHWSFTMIVWSLPGHAHTTWLEEGTLHTAKFEEGILPGTCAEKTHVKLKRILYTFEYYARGIHWIKDWLQNSCSQLTASCFKLGVS